MVFNSQSFAVFFAIIFTLYWLFSKSLRIQNIILLLGSYFFYANISIKLLGYLILVSSVVFVLGVLMTKYKTKNKLFFYLGILQSLGGLLYFKYFNFFIDGVNQLVSSLGFSSSISFVNLIVPVGISFFTFKTLSYLVDIYNEKIDACNNPLVFLNYIAFFPTILSGPIDKGRDFIPQLDKKRSFDYNLAIEGSRQFLWGLAKKIILADSISQITTPIFNGFEDYSSQVLIICALLYTIQIYTDFSGYSDMAIGIGKLLGFNVAKNFNYPFFSLNIAQFWRGWHITLTTWLTEYLFTPLNIKFRDLGRNGIIAAVLINFTIIGFWHGANWTYILFGFMHGCLFIPLIISGKMNKSNKKLMNKSIPSGIEFYQMVTTFLLVTLTFVFFKLNTIKEAFDYIVHVFDFSLPTPEKELDSILFVSYLIFISILLVVFEWIAKKEEFALNILGNKKQKKFLSYIIYLVLLVWVIISVNNQQDFIYLQF